MSKWRNAIASVTLVYEIDARWPGRDRRRDGHIGDKAHRARGSATDHNPWVKDNKGVGVVRARDVDARLNGKTQNADALLHLLLAKARAGDPRFKNGGYIIYKHMIYSEKTNFRGARYTGPNGHTTVLHISFSKNRSGYDSNASWGISSSPSSDVMKCGDKGRGVAFLMAMLNILAQHGCAIDDKGRTTKAQLWVPQDVQAQEKYVFTCEGHVHVENFQRFLRAMWELAGKKGPAPSVDGIAGPQTSGGIAFWIPIVLEG